MARRRPPTVHGIAVVDKPAGVTSHDVVGMLRRRFGERRVGHAGTLDPGATGVLVVGFGNVTRLLRFIVDGRKSYCGEIVIGIETDSLDADGAVTVTHDVAPSTSTCPSGVAERLTGDIEQVPPMVSALRSTAGVSTSSPATGSRSSASRDRCGSTASTSSTTSDADGRPVLQVEVDCSPARTSVRSPPTSDICSAPAPTSATCAAPPSSRSRSTRPRRPTTAGCFPDRRRAGDDEGGRRRADAERSPSASCCPRRRATHRGRWSPSDDLSAVYEPLDQGPPSRRSCCSDGAATDAGSNRSASSIACPVASRGVDVITELESAPWPGDALSSPSVRTTASTSATRPYRPGSRHRCRVRRPLGRAHLRPPSGDARPARVGARAAHRTGARLELLAATGVDATVVMPFDEEQSTSRPSRSCSASSSRAGRAHDRGRRGLPLRRRSAGSRRPAREARPDQRLRRPSDRAGRAARRRRRADQLHGDPARPRRRRRHQGGEHARRQHEVRGTVVMGDQRGRLLGFPTANVAVPNTTRVHARRWRVRRVVRATDGDVHPCAINLGRRPTFYEHADASLLEAHLLDFSGDLYGEQAEVRFAHFLRSERKFDGIEAIVAQLTSTSPMLASTLRRNQGLQRRPARPGVDVTRGGVEQLDEGVGVGIVAAPLVVRAVRPDDGSSTRPFTHSSKGSTSTSRRLATIVVTMALRWSTLGVAAVHQRAEARRRRVPADVRARHPEDASTPAASARRRPLRSARERRRRTPRDRSRPARRHVTGIGWARSSHCMRP